MLEPYPGLDVRRFRSELAMPTAVPRNGAFVRGRYRTSLRPIAPVTLPYRVIISFRRGESLTAG